MNDNLILYAIRRKILLVWWRITAVAAVLAKTANHLAFAVANCYCCLILPVHDVYDSRGHQWHNNHCYNQDKRIY